MVQIFFAYFALVSIAAGILTVSLRSPVHCGIALLALLGHVAGLFVLLHAEFVAVVQIIIYAGAILILYLFVLMLLNLKTEERYFHRRHAWSPRRARAIRVCRHWPICTRSCGPRWRRRWATPTG